MTKNKLTLALDIDSTIWDSQSLYSEAAEELFGHGFSAEDITHYYWLRDEYGDNFWEIFNKALHPSWIYKRDLYPDVVDTVQAIMNFDVNIHFVTHNVQADTVRKPLKKWLQDNFGDVELSVSTTGNKVPILNRIGAIGIVDDKFDTLKKVQSANMWACAFTQPWNEEQVKNQPYMDSFDNWKDGYDIIMEEVSLKMFRDRANSRLLQHI